MDSLATTGDDEDVTNEFLLSIRRAGKRGLGPDGGPVDILYEGSILKGRFRMEVPGNGELKLSFALDEARSEPAQFVFIQELITAVAVDLGRTPAWDGFLCCENGKTGSEGGVLVAFATKDDIEKTATRFAEFDYERKGEESDAEYVVIVETT
ncbi:hypothetical protein FOZ61_002435 [Perkinsus olseni]|uniref:Uncharacterized protein n=1 Tax=Perkinsus olseni TaxID=32597 RepID=A0A7J6LTD5_PEROL|nr:hypothetical protein FOZ61_002435 [Perkinsus olseni]